jgi:hypothetical protein
MRMDRQTRAIEDVYARRYQSFRGALAGIVGSYELAHDVVQESFARALASRWVSRRTPVADTRVFPE